MGAFEDQIRQNMALFDRAMKMFTPFAFRADEVTSTLRTEGKKTTSAPPAEDDELAQLKAQMSAMQAQLKALAAKK
jgi:polyhydroxyalkanoate synthesis regulator protein